MSQLFLDLDGVFADFDHHVETLCGILPRALGDDKLWELIEQHPTFWDDIPMMEDAMDLWNVAKHHNPIFITGCPSTGYDRAAASKPKWVAKHLGDHPVITCRSKFKPQFMERPGDILIDDFIANIKRWEKAGGRTIYHKSAAQTIPRLLKMIEEIVK